MAIAQTSQKVADRTLVQLDAETPFEFGGQIAATPTNHFMDGRIGTFLDEPAQDRFLLRRQR
jgi:hypothetical protein